MAAFNKTLYEKYYKTRELQRRIIDEDNFTYRNLLAILRNYIDGKTKILDIGCGVGTIDFYLAAKGKNVTGIDISRNALDVARENAKILGFDKGIKFLRRNFPKSIPQEKFDLVICSEVLEHLRDDKKAVRKIYDCLKKDGLAIISIPSKNAPLYKMGLLGEFDKEVGHLRRYTLEELRSIFGELGFNIINTAKTEGILRNFLFTNPIASKFLRFIKWWISDLLTLVDNLTIPLFGESQIYLVAKK